MSALRVLGLMMVSSWLVVGCSSAKKIEPGAACLLNTDCNNPLVCSMDKCHDACHGTADCPLGQSCVKTAQGTVCQLPDEASCSQTCGDSLVCASDLRCRAGCLSAADCAEKQLCVSGVCADPAELNTSGQLPQLAPDSGVKLAVGSVCSLNSDCQQSLVCTMGKCHDACHTTADCPSGQSCVRTDNATVCQLPAEASCSATSCGGALVCASDLRCRAGCLSPADCASGQVCVSGVCADPADLDINGQLPQRRPGPVADAGANLSPDAGSKDSGVAGVPDALSPRTDALPDFPTDGTTGADGSAGAVGYGISGQSCKGMNGTECSGESCCTSLPVPAGTFPMGRSTETCANCTAGCPGGVTCNADETPEHNVTVSAFSLDKYEVTVGRFRRFVDAYDAMNAPPPVNGGAHPQILGTGWLAAWNGNMPASATQFRQELAGGSICQSVETWDKGNDQLPINCVSWYEAFAFYIWDGARLPTEAEWEYAAAGGSENRIYPWGSNPPTCTLANFLGCVGAAATVGSYSAGQGRWGHLDLAGNLWEWVFDWYSSNWYSSPSASGADIADTTSASYHVGRGSSWNDSVTYLRASARFTASPFLPGLRCARNP